jgi:cysteine desulfurase
MAANNEIGTVHPIAEIGAICRKKGALFHCDATQAIGKLRIDVEEMNIDLLAMSAHKMYGPKGVGALYVRRRKPRVRLVASIDGGGHERGMRSGTLNVTGIVGMGKAAEILIEELDKDVEHVSKLRDRMDELVFAELDHVNINGDKDARLPNTTNISFAYVEGESLLMGIKDIAVSSGSACTSASLEPSYVLRALGVGDELAHSSIRFSFGRFNNMEEVEHAAKSIISAVKKLRELSPLYEMVQEGIDITKIEWQAH